MSRILVHLCIQASFFIDWTWIRRRGSKHGRIWRGQWRWHRQQHDVMIELYVTYLCHKMMIMYCCVKTIWIVDLCLVVWILYVLLYNLLLYALFWRLSIRGDNQNMEYIKTNIFHYIYRLHITEKYTFIFLDTDEYSDIYSSMLYSSVNQGI
jgi:hypothetical protein